MGGNKNGVGLAHPTKALLIVIGLLVLALAWALGEIISLKAEQRATAWGCEWHYTSLTEEGICK